MRSDELEEYTLTWIVGQNLFLLTYFGIGFAGMLQLRLYGYPLLSIFYASFLITMLLFILRANLCTHCYYYGKRCNTGWGKLSSLMFKKDSGNFQLGIKLAGATWMIATLTPIFGASLSLILKFSTITLTLLLLFISLTPINFLIHREACGRCKMRFTCPASLKKG